MVFEIRKGPREIRIWIMMNNNSQFLFLKWIFRRCVGGIIQSVQQRVRIRLLKKQRRSICHVTSGIKQSITHNRLVLHYSRSVKRCYGYYRLVLRGATLCFPIIEVYFVPSDRPSVSKYHPSSQVFLEAAADMYAVHGTLDSAGLASEPFSMLMSSDHVGIFVATYT